MKIILDTNIYIAAFLSQNFQSVPSKIIDLAQDGEFDVFISSEIIQEIHHVLMDKLNLKEQEIAEILSEINFFTKKIVVIERVNICNDVDDDKFFALAKQLKADFLISLDKKHIIPIKKFGNTKTIFPSDFLKIFYL
jgi:putative PIN family toxin of toxin-antitoxin system